MKSKVLIFIILFLAIFITLAIIIRNKAKKYGLHTRDIPTALSVKLSDKKCDFNAKNALMGGLPDGFKGGLIAHAGGGIIQDLNTQIYTYTNSKEALLQSIREGFKFIEIDLMLDSKGEIFGAHDYKHFYDITSDSKGIFKDTPPSPEYIKSSKIHNKFSTLTLDSINEIFLANPQIYLVTDKLNDFKAITTQLKFQDRILVEVFGLGAYYAALRAGVKYPMLSSGDFKLAMKLGIPMMATHSSILQDSKSLELAREYITQGGCIAVFSSNDSKFIESNLGNSATFIYTDFTNPKTNHCKLENTPHAKTCKTY